MKLMEIAKNVIKSREESSESIIEVGFGAGARRY